MVNAERPFVSLTDSQSVRIASPMIALAAVVTTRAVSILPDVIERSTQKTEESTLIRIRETFLRGFH